MLRFIPFIIGRLKKKDRSCVILKQMNKFVYPTNPKPIYAYGKYGIIL